MICTLAPDAEGKLHLVLHMVVPLLRRGEDGAGLSLFPLDRVVVRVVGLDVVLRTCPQPVAAVEMIYAAVPVDFLQGRIFYAGVPVQVGEQQVFPAVEAEPDDTGPHIHRDESGDYPVGERQAVSVIFIGKHSKLNRHGFVPPALYRLIS